MISDSSGGGGGEAGKMLVSSHRFLEVSMILSLLFACATQTIGGDTATDKGSDPDDTAADTDADADTDTDADADADTDSDTDSDTDTDTDSDTDTDTDADADPVEPNDLVGRVFQVSLANADITEPAGVGSILGAYITQDLLLEVSAADETTISFLTGISVADSKPVEQDLCVPTVEMTGGDFSANPDFELGPTELTLSVSGSDVTLSDLYLGGTFDAAGETLEDGVMEGLIDTRPLDSAFGGDEGYVCDLVGSFGANCEPCPDGEEFCLKLRAENIEAPWVEDLKLEIVTEVCP